MAERTHHTPAFNSPQTTLWLAMELPHRAMVSPTPYIYLVDRLSQLSENHLWFESRRQVVDAELVMDTVAVVTTTADSSLRIAEIPSQTGVFVTIR